MARKLGPDEAALWSRVAATVRPLAHRPRMKFDPPGPLPAAALPAVAVRPAAAPPPKTPVKAAPPVAATLDGHWDRDIRRGRLAPERAVDLHGYGRDAAFDLLSDTIRAADRDGARVLLVVTGKGARGGEGGRGVIRSALPHWLETPALRPYVAALRPAHPRHGGSGAWYVILRRRRTTDAIGR
ncbi:MAG: Smr/MutS family protein [Alphaproteobacteria bacterium]|nr:Smr/MutS family protein [Alphaproteobacteria bacterium]